VVKNAGTEITTELVSASGYLINNEFFKYDNIFQEISSGDNETFPLSK
jgi:hypothetical protein